MVRDRDAGLTATERRQRDADEARDERKRTRRRVDNTKKRTTEGAPDPFVGAPPGVAGRRVVVIVEKYAGMRKGDAAEVVGYNGGCDPGGIYRLSNGRTVPASREGIAWSFVEGDGGPLPLPTKQPAGQNDPCPCGSGWKRKRCCADGGVGGAILPITYYTATAVDPAARQARLLPPSPPPPEDEGAVDVE